jgi:hypothetical protein
MAPTPGRYYVTDQSNRWCVPGIPSPSWPLLLWCGLAASLAGELLAAAFRPARRTRLRGRAPTPRLMSTPRENVPIALAAGTLVIAPIYGLVFEGMQRADWTTGATIGAVHGVIAAAFALGAAARTKNRNSESGSTPLGTLALFRARRLIGRIAYGAALGFLYAAPGSGTP